MPLYEYVCPHCAEKKEVLARSAQAARVPECAACGAPMEKAWSAVACHTKAAGGSCAGSGRGFS